MSAARMCLKASLVTGAVLSCAACGPRFEVIDQVPQGTVNGEPWEMGTAVVSLDSFDETRLDLDLFGEETGACDSFASSDLLYIIWGMPAAVGVYELQFNLFNLDEAQTVTFVVPPANNFIAGEGILEVEELTDTSVTIGMDVMFDSEFQVNGRFTTELCGGQ